MRVWTTRLYACTVHLALARILLSKGADQKKTKSSYTRTHGCTSILTHKHIHTHTHIKDEVHISVMLHIVSDVTCPNGTNEWMNFNVFLPPPLTTVKFCVTFIVLTILKCFHLENCITSFTAEKQSWHGGPWCTYCQNYQHNNLAQTPQWIKGCVISQSTRELLYPSVLPWS